MRAAGEALGAAITWDGDTQGVTVKKDGDTVQFFVGNPNYYINGELYSTDVAPTIIKNRTMLPLRAFAESLGTRVDWDQYLLDVSISTTGEQAKLPTPPIDTTNDVYKYIQKYYTVSSDANTIFGSWTYHGFVYGVETEAYEFFYDTPQGIQNVEIVASYYPYFDSPTINIYKSDVKQDNSRYLRFNFQNIIYSKDMAHGYTGHSDTEYQMIKGNLYETGILWYQMGSDLFERYDAVGPNAYLKF